MFDQRHRHCNERPGAPVPEPGFQRQREVGDREVLQACALQAWRQRPPESNANADADSDELELEVGLEHLDGDRERDVSGFEGALEHATIATAAATHHPCMAAQRLEGDCACQRRLDGRDEGQGLGRQADSGEVCRDTGMRGHEHNGGVEQSVFDGAAQLAGRAAAQLQLDPGVLLPQFLHQRGHQL